MAANQWEYKIVTKETKNFTKKDEVQEDINETLNELGKSGWELVSVTPFSATQGMDLGGSTKALTFFFKKSV